MFASLNVLLRVFLHICRFAEHEFVIVLIIMFQPVIQDSVCNLPMSCQKVLVLFSNMQLSIHDGLAHKNVFHGIPLSTTTLIYYGNSDN